MASITAKGFCDVAVESRYTNGVPGLVSRWKMGNSLRISVTFSMMEVQRKQVHRYKRIPVYLPTF